MASRLRNIVQPVFGWLFILLVILALVAAILSATQPRVGATGQIPVQQAN
jgi:hypothetical protein